MIRALALTFLAAHALEPELTESVSLLQTGASKKQKPNIVPLKMGPPWDDVDAAAFAAMKSEGMGMIDRTALELDLTDKEPEGELPEGMRFALAGQHEGADVDLLVTAETKRGPTKYNAGKLNESKGEFNGLYNGFARVYVKSGSTQQIKLSVVKAGTTEALKIPLLAVSFFSLGGYSKGAKKNPTSVADCNANLVSEFWAAPNVKNSTGGCGNDALLFQGTGQLKGKGKSDPKSVAEVGDDHCWNSLVLKWFDAETITLELTAGDPAGKKGIPFMFKVGLTQCDVTWEPPPTKAELKAIKAAEKAAAKALKDEEKAKKAAEKAAAAKAKAAAKAAKR